MPGVDAITLNPTLMTAVAAVVVGFAAFWSNPHRRINVTFFTASLHVALWLFSLHLAVSTPQGQWWVRVASAVGAFFPLHLWLLKEASINRPEGWLRLLWKNWWWPALATGFAAMCFTELYIPQHSNAERPLFGPGYYAYIVVVVGLYATLCHETIRQMRAQRGLSRLELQILLLGSSSAAVTVILLMALRALLELPWLIGLQPAVVLIFYTGTVVAITTGRVFDARQILLVAGQNLSLVVVVGGVAFVLDRLFRQVLLPEPFALLATTALALWFAAILNEWLSRIFHSYPQAVAARQAAYLAARRETRGENLEQAFAAVLQGWGQSDQAIIVAGTKDSLHGTGIDLAGDATVVKAIRQLRWATPERLARERATPEREALGQFLQERGLGVLVIGEGPTLTALVGVGVPASRRPFTYPQVTQLMELASIIESALERAHFSVKAQHAEQLATVGLLGASLAHEIRNPLVTIKTFVQLLPQHHQDPVFREKFFRLISDEVGRIDRLTEQLLDLASPRVYSASVIELHPVLRASLDLVAAKATDKNIQFLTDLQAGPDRAFTDPSAAKQVLLNLCFNAIQAIEGQAGERWVKISTRNTPAGLEMAVADSGPGIVEEIRARLFQPFQTTKSSGFGLGLAICSDILANLNASISVDPPAPGCGATFRVTFPCQPS
jgi:signal transduction histidine kinase